ncbi:MAG TPA: hypothetical protein RMH85_01310 [Polyangiaceae bacterium LLY-WYZ-15_(1-7)]|nr:hypothetical protein [Polyangiaceae bacterium LLY-WYZ-15_(1-7)]HJL00459.1 hypothetical protein [Polyangiaceae bacterium LLY-WYZ-15_(1-7)]HJL07100.1 hypothetical protein [Polyangiaceae bacterium LLY-WYZ-15_(1-7)]HJL25264.1 hypothetical protein [Polyangiaceae bacterium LLY-WYZ-15_(1-7)]HJL37283.1 hypothetical protein [Polyangiaceae bacterium LLY-WYZ-15_(1-7)]
MRRFSLSLLLVVALGGCGDDDGVAPGVDAGGPGVDSGVPGVDSGVPGVDSGVPGVDSGVPGVDSGTPGEDAGTPPVEGDPSAAGPFSVTTTDGSVSRASRTTPVVAHVPTGDGTFPLIVLVPGFQLESTNYLPLAERLASHGFVVVRADPDQGGLLGGTNHVEMRDDLIAVIDWATTSGPVAGSVDATQIGVTGHSLGGKLSTMVAAADSRVGAVFGIDPVDGGGGPLGGDPAATPDIVPSQSNGITAAVGFIGETTNGSGGFMPCAPMDQNFQQFYEGTTMASWAAEWDVLGADHMDFVYDTTGCGFACSACPNGSVEASAVQAITSTIGVAFFRRHLAGETAMEQWLTGGSVPGGVDVRSR